MIRFTFTRVLRHTEERLGAAILAAGLLLFAAQPVFAHGFKVGELDIGHPWSRVTPAGAKVAGGYLAIKNDGKDADTLIGATAEIAEQVQIHEMSVKDGIMTMRMLEAGLPVPAGEEVKLAPGGFHLMMMGIKQPLKEGESFKGTLTFAKAGTVAVEFKVEGMGGPKGAKTGASQPAEDHSAHGAPAN